MEVREFQQLIAQIYFERDRARGLPATFSWLSTMASICGIDLERAAAKYADGCPKCGGIPCRCP